VVDAETLILGEWRQIEPDPSPVSIFVTFENGGGLQYRIEAATTQFVLLTWRIDGDVLITNQPSAPAEMQTRFHFASSSLLVLEWNGERFAYERT
jgi:hypothetical protein